MSVYNGTYKIDNFVVESTKRETQGYSRFVLKNSTVIEPIPSYMFVGSKVYKVYSPVQETSIYPKDHLAVFRKANLNLIEQVEGTFTNHGIEISENLPTQNNY